MPIRSSTPGLARRSRDFRTGGSDVELVLGLGLCVEDLPYPIGRDDAVRRQSNRDLGRFLARIFRLPPERPTPLVDPSSHRQENDCRKRDGAVPARPKSPASSAACLTDRPIFMSMVSTSAAPADVAAPMQYAR